MVFGDDRLFDDEDGRFFAQRTRSTGAHLVGTDDFILRFLCQRTSSFCDFCERTFAFGDSVIFLSERRHFSQEHWHSVDL